MDIKIIEEAKNRLVFQIEGENHTLANALKGALREDSHVKVVGYTIDHPLLGNPQFVLETDGADPKKTISAAVKSLDKQLDKIKDEAKKIK